MHRWVCFCDSWIGPSLAWQAKVGALGLPRTPMTRRHGMPRDDRMRAGRASRPVVEHHLPPQKRSIRVDKVALFLRFSHSASSILRSFAVALFLRIGLSAECHARSFAKRSGPPLAMLAVALFLRIGPFGGVPREVLREALRTTARDARGGFVPAISHLLRVPFSAEEVAWRDCRSIGCATIVPSGWWCLGESHRSHLLEALIFKRPRFS